MGVVTAQREVYSSCVPYASFCMYLQTALLQLFALCRLGPMLFLTFFLDVVCHPLQWPPGIQNVA